MFQWLPKSKHRMAQIDSTNGNLMKRTLSMALSGPCSTNSTCPKPTAIPIPCGTSLHPMHPSTGAHPRGVAVSI
jgi:hypothetical protein